LLNETLAAAANRIDDATRDWPPHFQNANGAPYAAMSIKPMLEGSQS